MLDLGDQSSSFDARWGALPLRVELTNELRAAHGRRGPLPTIVNDRRRYARFYFWRRAILARGERTYAGYTVNLSKSGMRLVSPEQIFPCERVRVALETGETFPATIRRCRRLGESCYECGAELLVNVHA